MEEFKGPRQKFTNEKYIDAHGGDGIESHTVLQAAKQIREASFECQWERSKCQKDPILWKFILLF